MENIYGTKKYFQSIGRMSSNDYYRNSTTRALANDYSYQNTLGRRSTLGLYSHMNKFTYPDPSIQSHYGGGGGGGGYNSWGFWPDTRNLTPSSYASSKSNSKVRSCSIILMTAAFIVILAVLSVAALAFYFSTFKSDLNDSSLMVFDGKFTVTRGDVFTTGLRYNHTTSFKQKSEFYGNFLIDALEHNGLEVAKCEIHGFGEGPLIVVNFRVYLDMRKVPITIKSVEDHVQDSILNELAVKSNRMKGIKIDEIEIKRLLDQDILKSASFIREPSGNQPTSVLFEEKVNKKTGVIEKAVQKVIQPSSTTSSTTSNNKAHSPVIQGSFQVTKTEADIIQKRTNAPSQLPTSTLRPFSITNSGVRIKTKKTTIEKVKPLRVNGSNTTHSVLNVNKMNQNGVTNDNGLNEETSVGNTSTNPTIDINTTKKTSDSDDESILKSSESPSLSVANENSTRPDMSNVKNPPKLDVHLFTSAPVLDDQPWRPIQGPSPILENTNNRPIKTDIQSSVVTGSNDNDDDDVGGGVPKLPVSEEPDTMNPIQLPKNKIKFSEPVSSSAIPSDDKHIPFVYQSFKNPSLIFSPQGIEKLGSVDVKPYPIPVDKIYGQQVPDFKPIKQNGDGQQMMETGPYIETTNNTRFEHLGGGVIIKQSEIRPTAQSKPIESIPSKLEPAVLSEISTGATNQMEDDSTSTEYSVQLGDFLLDLLELNKDDSNATSTMSESLESRINDSNESTESSNLDENPAEKLNFKNLKDHIIAMSKNQTKTIDSNEQQSKFNLNSNMTEDKLILNANVTNRNTFTSGSPPLYSGEFEYETVSDRSGASASTSTALPSPASSISSGSGEQPSLFPMHNTKWEFVNGSLIPPIENSAARKVFNHTLQAWVVENPSLPSGSITDSVRIDKLKVNRENNTDNLQNLSSIFDTLASKLNIAPRIPTKLPPFNSLAQSKLKNKYANRQPSSTSPQPQTSPAASASGTDERINSKINKNLTNPSLIRIPSTTETIDGDSLPILLEPEANNGFSGQAEVEVVDPTQYEEMLQVESRNPHLRVTTQTPTLVTLLPVKSNVGLRTFRPPINKNDDQRIQSKRTAKPLESIIRSEINVTT